MQSKKVLIIDCGGLFPEMGVRMARDAASVKYYSEWRDDFPGIDKAKVGEGLDGIERVDNYEDYLDNSDLIVSPDTMTGPLVEFLKKHDYPVAGPGRAEWLENNRWDAKKFQKDSGLPIQESNRVVGISALRNFLKDKKNYYIKIDKYRAVMESFKHTDATNTEQELDAIAVKLGPFKEDIVFVVEEFLEGEEPGLDGISWEGDLLYPCQIGYEAKGVGVIERTYNTANELPEPAKQVNAGLSKAFKKDKFRFFFSSEFKLGKDRNPFVIDNTIRLAAPGTSSIQYEIIKNYTAVMHGLATGVKVNPIITDKYGIAIAGESPVAEKRYLNVSFPKEMRQWIKLRHAVKRGKDYFATPGLPSVVTVIALGNTIDETLNTLEARTKEVKASSLNFAVDDLRKLKDSINKAKAYGLSPF